MLDIKLIRENPEAINKKIQTKVPEASVNAALDFDTRIRHLKSRAETLKSQRNAKSGEIGKLKREGKETTALMTEVAESLDEIHALDKEITELEAKLIDSLARLPNIPMDDVKISLSPADNEVVKLVGKKPEFNFPFRHHVELNEKLKLFDFERGAKITGSGWPVYVGMGARLEWALINFMLSVHIERGFTQWIPPLVVKPEAMFASGQFPKFAGQVYALNDDDYKFYMIPTSEIPLNALHMDEIFEESQLPLKYVAYSPCFRREAGAAGSKERGLIRVHQFNKVEMFAFTKPEESMSMFQTFLDSAEYILQKLGIHYRLCLLVTGDQSFGSARTVDVEVWLPGQDRYYEVSSISNCTDFQSRRSNTRFRRKGEKPELVHTLNGSGLATSRLMVSILENNQQADGSVIIPEVLRPYLGGVDRLVPQA